MKKISDGTMGLLVPEPLGQGGPDVLLGMHNSAKAKGCHNILKTHHKGLDRAPNPADDIENEAPVYVCDENHRNQQDLLKDYFNHVGTLGWQENRD